MLRLSTFPFKLSVLSTALNATGGLLKKFGLWDSSTPVEEQEAPTAPGDNMHVRGKLANSNNLIIVDVAALTTPRLKK